MKGRIVFPKIGLRNVKTAISVLICLVLFQLFERNPVYACIAAVVSMQNTLENSIAIGADRLIGTAVGGAIGLLFILSKLLFFNIWVYFVITAIGVVIVIYANVLIKKPGSVAISCVVFLIIMINAENVQTTTAEALIYAVNRILDTAIGVAIAVAINFVIKRRKYVAKEIEVVVAETAVQEQGDKAE